MSLTGEVNCIWGPRWRVVLSVAAMTSCAVGLYSQLMLVEQGLEAHSSGQRLARHDRAAQGPFVSHACLPDPVGSKTTRTFCLQHPGFT